MDPPASTVALLEQSLDERVPSDVDQLGAMSVPSYAAVEVEGLFQIA